MLAEKLITPSGAHVLCFSDGAETASVPVSESIYARYAVGQRCAIMHNGHYLIGIAHASDPPCEKDACMFEQQTVTVTIRTWGKACELSDEQIATWYRDGIESLLDPNIGSHEITVSVERKPIERPAEQIASAEESDIVQQKFAFLSQIRGLPIG